ncbi:hypothetical protein GGF31_004574 [Allomyces arbusculus]|nr:hypothetical protein GGF31_004574 [Allomyces arbusculus]
MSSSTRDKNAPPPKDVISRLAWDTLLDSVNVSMTDLNKLVLNYLVIEGHMDAAQQFCAETGLTPAVDLASIHDRMTIRTAIDNGRVDDAMERLNDLDPEILDTNPQLYFHLQQQRLIETIRAGDIPAALEFAQSELAPRGEENPAFLVDLERTLALLAFDATDANSPVADLLAPAHRHQVAAETNAAILHAQGQATDPKLPAVLRAMTWAQSKLEERAVFPKVVDVVQAELVVPPECDGVDAGGMQF